MPRPAINDYTFYKIVNVNGDVDLCYVGSTCNMKHRRSSHKSLCMNEKHKYYNCKVYKTIREHGGWGEFKMIEIGTAEQLTHVQALQIEETYRVQLKANLNTIKCFTTEQEIKENTKQYRIDNVDKIKEKTKQYRIDNVDKIKQHRIDTVDKIRQHKNTKHTCDCGGKYTLSNKSQHIKTKTHQKYIQSLTPDI